MSQMRGKIGVTTENIFPVIKKFLYSDHEIFLRELVANAVDASQKMKAISLSGEFKGELGDLQVKLELDKDKKILKVCDSGIGMTEEELDKYINQIAFSSAGEFLSKYKDQLDGIIGHFGLGFYSAFMVSKTVTIETLSWKGGAKAVKWSCDGSPDYLMDESDKKERGTEITLYLDDDSLEFAEKEKINSLLNKYCKFMPIPVIFGKEQEWKDGNYVDTDKDNIINKIEPIWVKAPSELKDEDYQKFYRELYPMADEPLFHIHLNVDYPFNLTGVLYFPKIKERMSIDRNKIQLYCNQMFVTDHVDNIVPEFLTLLHGLIDSPDIPLNVSRSYLQSDANVKKISTYITKKVADRLEEIYKSEREEFENKWDNLKLFIEYGMLSDEKFCERALKFALFKNTDGKYFNFEDYKKAVESEQTDKEKKVVYLYASKPDEQYQFIEIAKNKGYDVLLFDSELDNHFVNLLEQKLENVRFARVDSAPIEQLIVKDEAGKEDLGYSEEELADVSVMFKAVLPKDYEYNISLGRLGTNSVPVLITQNEFMRRYRDMSSMGGGLNFYGSMPKSYELTVNADNPIVSKLLQKAKTEIAPMETVDASLIESEANAKKMAEEKEATQEQKEIFEQAKKALKEAKDKVSSEHEKQVEEFALKNDIIKQLADLALLSNGLLKAKALSDFINRSSKLLEDSYR